MKKRPLKGRGKANKPPPTEAGQVSKPGNETGASGWTVRSFSTPEKDVHVLMPTDIVKHHGDPENPEQKSYSLIRERLQGDLDWLRDMADKGEWTAVTMLAEFGADFAFCLDHLSKANFDLVKRVARRHSEWPVVMTPEPNYPQDLKALRSQIELGKGVSTREDKVLHKKKPLLQRVAIYHTLSIFEGLRYVGSLHAKIQKLKSALAQIPRSTADQVEGEFDTSNPAGVSAVLTGEIVAAQRRSASATARVKRSKRALRNLLKIPTPSPDVAPPAVSELWTQLFQLPTLTRGSKDQWVEFIIAFLVAFMGKKLEENEVLRKIGDTRGDVEIRARCEVHPPSPQEFNRLKEALRHDPKVNYEIGHRIEEKLEDALALFLPAPV